MVIIVIIMLVVRITTNARHSVPSYLPTLVRPSDQAIDHQRSPAQIHNHHRALILGPLCLGATSPMFLSMIYHKLFTKANNIIAIVSSLLRDQPSR
jgi:hypothetical protein